MKKSAAVIAGLLLSVIAMPTSAIAQSSRGPDGAAVVVNQVNAQDVIAMMSNNGLVQGAGIVRVDETVFQAGSGLITFSEFGTGTSNPTYNPADYGGVAGDPVVTFKGFFAGQALGDATTCPAGAALSGCVVGDPSDPLALDAASPNTSIVNDGANPTSPVLSGSPTFNGPIAILFDVDLAGVGLEGGFFNAVGGTAITAFARDGTVLGSVLNEGTGIEFLGLVTADNSDSIAGLLFSLVGSEPAGFAIDNLRFGSADNISPPPSPIGPYVAVPALGFNALGLMALALVLSGLLLLRRRA